MKGIAFTICWLLIAACDGIKTKLTTEDLKWVDYKQGDTLIFKSNKGNADTVIVSEKSIYYPEYNPIELHDKYLPQMAIVKARRGDKETFTFVELEKRKPNESANWGIEIKFPGFFTKMSDTIGVVNLKLNSGYENVLQLSQSDTDIERFGSNATLFVSHIYLKLNYRIIAYEMSDGELYERVR